jgi:hypothetical protein
MGPWAPPPHLFFGTEDYKELSDWWLVTGDSWPPRAALQDTEHQGRPPPTPGTVGYQNKGLANWAVPKCLKRKEGQSA